MTESTDWRQEFDRLTMHYATVQYPGFQAIEENKKLSALRELHAEWMNVEGRKERQQPPEAAAAAFSRWLVEFHVPNLNRPTINIHSERTINYGSVSQTYGITRQFHISDGRWLNSARQKVDIEIEQLFQYFERAILPTINSAPPKQAVGQGGETRQIDVIKIAAEWKSGKRYIKVYGNPWGKHGVVIWDEVIKTMDLPPEALTPEGYAPLGWKAEIEVSNGHPRRVLKITGV